MKKILISLSVVAMLSACSSDDPYGPIQTGIGYFTANVGSVWIYSNTYLDTNGVASPLDGIFDTIKILNDTTYLNRPAKWMRHHFVNTTTNETTNGEYAIREDGDKLYISTEFMALFLPEMLSSLASITLPQAYYKIADASVNTWTLDSFNITDLELPIPNYDAQISGLLKFIITRKADSTIEGYTETNVYQLTTVLQGTVKVTLPIVGTTMLPITSNFAEIDFYLKQGKGLIGIYNKPMTVSASVQLIGSLPIATQSGYKKLLVSSDIK